MFEQGDIHIQRGRRRSLGMMLIVPGLLFIGLGILVIVVPELLRIMVASAFIFIGVLLMMAGWRMGRAQKAMREAFEQPFDIND